MNRAKKILRWLMLLTLGWAVVYIIGSVVNSLTTFTSFPWWSGLVFAAIYFGPALLLEAVAYGLLAWFQRKR